MLGARPARLLPARRALGVGHVYSYARNRRVGYTIAYPPGHAAGAALPLASAEKGTAVLAALVESFASVLEILRQAQPQPRSCEQHAVKFSSALWSAKGHEIPAAEGR